MGYLKGETLAGIKQWFRQYLGWITTHPYGIDERNSGNNHSAAWALQVTAFAQLVGDEPRLASMRRFFRETLVPEQMAADGSFPRELARTKPYGYWPVRNPALLFGGLALHEPRYLDLWTTLAPDPRVDEVVRNYPIRQPLLWMRQGADR